MGIHDLLPRLPGGDRYIHSLLELGISGAKVPLDAAGALFQFAMLNATDFLRGNHTPSLVMWSRYLNYCRSICGIELHVVFDGMENPSKQHKKDRRRKRMETARSNNNLRGMIRNSPK